MKSKTISRKQSTSKNLVCRFCGDNWGETPNLICPECKTPQTSFEIWKLKYPRVLFLLNAFLLPALLLTSANIYALIQRRNDDADKHIAEVRSVINELRSVTALFATSCFATKSNDCRKALDLVSDRYLTVEKNFSYVVNQYAPETNQSLAVISTAINDAEFEYHSLWQKYLTCIEGGESELKCMYQRRQVPIWRAAAALYVANYVACKAESNINYKYLPLSGNDTDYCKKILSEDKLLAFDAPSSLTKTMHRDRNSSSLKKIVDEIISKKILPGSGAIADPLKSTQ